MAFNNGKESKMLNDRKKSKMFKVFTNSTSNSSFVVCVDFDSMWSCRTKSDQVFAFGDNFDGQLGIGKKCDIVYTNCDNTVVKTPKEISYYESQNLDVYTINCGESHTMILTEDCNTLSCGSNDEGQLSIGSNRGGHCEVPMKLELDQKLTIDEVSCGDTHTLFLAIGGILLASGSNEFGQLGVGDQRYRTTAVVIPFFTNKQHNISSISCGSSYSAVVVDGRVFTFGFNGTGQLALGHTDLARNTPQHVTSLDAVSPSSVHCGFRFTIITALDGRVFAAGCGESGQLGLGDNMSGRLKPEEILFFRKHQLRQLSCGGDHVLCLTQDGFVFGWGRNSEGQLSLGDKNDRTTPTKITFFKQNKVVLVRCGFQHSLFLTSDGALFSAGNNDFGQLGVGDERNRNIATRIKFFDDKIIVGTPAEKKWGVKWCQLYPLEFREQIEAIMSLWVLDEDEYVYPDCTVILLPMEMLFLLFRYMWAIKSHSGV